MLESPKVAFLLKDVSSTFLKHLLFQEILKTKVIKRLILLTLLMFTSSTHAQLQKMQIENANALFVRRLMFPQMRSLLLLVVMHNYNQSRLLK